MIIIIAQTYNCVYKKATKYNPLPMSCRLKEAKYDKTRKLYYYRFKAGGKQKRTTSKVILYDSVIILFKGYHIFSI